MTIASYNWSAVDNTEETVDKTEETYLQLDWYPQ